MAQPGDDKARLIARLDRARAGIAAGAHQLGDDLDPVAAAKRSFARHRWLWIGGAAALGLLITRSFRGEKSRGTGTKPRAGLLAGALKLAFTLARPALVAWAGKRVAEYAAQRREQS